MLHVVAVVDHYLVLADARHVPFVVWNGTQFAERRLPLHKELPYCFRSSFVHTLFVCEETAVRTQEE